MLRVKKRAKTLSSKTQRENLSLKLLSPAISLPLYALSTGSESMNASNTSCIKFSQLPNPYLYNLMSVQFPRSTPSSSVVTLARPLTSFSLKITARSFRYASPCLWNQLPLSLRQFHSGASSSISDSPIPSPVTSSSSVSPLCSPITLSLSPVFVSLFVYPGDI